MDETGASQVQDLTADALRQVLQYVQEGEGFVREQAPLVVQEIVRWGIASAVLGVLANAVVLLVCAWIVKRAVAWFACNDHLDDAAPFYFIGGAASALGVTGAVIGLFISLTQLAYVIFSPRLYVIERLSELVR